MRDVPQSNEHKPGTWKGLQTPVGRSASFTCPACSQMATLTDHTIQGDGTVQPSVVCPSHKCTFHEYLRLIGWEA